MIAAGDFSPPAPRVCRGCGRRGEWSGFCAPCPACRGDVERAA